MSVKLLKEGVTLRGKHRGLKYFEYGYDKDYHAKVRDAYVFKCREWRLKVMENPALLSRLPHPRLAEPKVTAMDEMKCCDNHPNFADVVRKHNENIQIMVPCATTQSIQEEPKEAIPEKVKFVDFICPQCAKPHKNLRSLNMHKIHCLKKHAKSSETSEELTKI